jgi:hypothetical protein
MPTGNKENVAKGGDEFPRSWRFGTGKDEDGLTIEGTFVGWSRGHTEHGSKPILLLEVGGEVRSVWLMQTVLRSKIARKVGERRSHDFEPGERIVITELGRVQPKGDRSGKQPYRNFAVNCPDEQPLTASAVLGEELDDEQGSIDENGDVKPTPADDDIPF